MFILLVPKMLVHFLFEHILDGVSEKVLDGILEIRRRLDIVHTDEIAEELALFRAHLGGLISERRCRLVFLGSSEELCCLLMRDIINHPPSKSTIAGWDGFQLTEFCSHSLLYR